MAGDWIKMRIDLQTHPKIVRILSATKADKFRVIGGLHAVWSVFDTHSSDGRLNGYTAEALDHIIGWNGFAKAMIDVGWLVEDGEVALLLPEFDEHNGASGKRRAEDQKRKRNTRKNPQSVRNLSANEPDAEWTREEKRREENNNTVVPLPMREEPPLSDDPAIQIAVALRRQGVNAAFTHPVVQDWASKGVSLAMLTEAVATARVNKPTGNIPANYLVPIIDTLLNPPLTLKGSGPAAPLVAGKDYL
jgi:hypothetical protein